MSTFTLTNNNGGIQFSGELTALDLVRLELTPFDRRLLNEISEASDATAADYILGLETLFRRLLEINP